MQQEVVELLRQLLGGVQCNLWHAISATNLYNYALQLATSLSMFEYESILLASGIMAKQGNSYAIKKTKLAELKDALKENLTLHITRSQIQRPGANSYFVAVERPTFRNPLEQAKANIILLPNRHGNGLDEVRLRLLARLCAEHAADEEPELIVDEQLPPPPQIEAQNQQENAPPQAEEAQQPRPARHRRVLQELPLQPVLERRTRRSADETQQEEANQIRLHRRAVAQEEHQLHLPPERRIRPRRNDNVKHPRRGIKNSSIA